MNLPNRQSLIEEASQLTELNDFGNTWFFDHIDHLIAALNTEARLTTEGSYGAQAMIVGALSNRLRHIALIKAHPEILEEDVQVAVMVTGLPRTGSTMLHRMLASSKGMTGVRWYEAQNYAPFPGEIRADASQRLNAARNILDFMLGKLPELMSIHPMSIDQPDEEVIILGQLFSSTMAEASYYVPSYARWLALQDPTPGYQDLHQILQSLQWQDPSREGKAWVLKTPGHLVALDTAMAIFNTAKIVMTHRDPIAVIPSYCSMEASLYKLASDTISHKMIGEYWPDRLHAWLEQFMMARAGNDKNRFIDVLYEDQLQHPEKEAARVLELAGIPIGDAFHNEIQDWIETNLREHRAPHRYDLADFGLEKKALSQQFDSYSSRYLRR